MSSFSKRESLCGHQHGGANLALSPCRTMLALGGGDTRLSPRREDASEIIVWELATRSPIWKRVEKKRGPIDGLRWSPNSSLVGCHINSSLTVDVHNIQTDDSPIPLSVDPHIIRDFQFVTPDTVIIATMYKGKCFIHRKSISNSTAADDLVELTLPAPEITLQSVLHDQSLQRMYVFANDYTGCVWVGLIDNDSLEVKWECQIPGILMDDARAAGGLVVLGGSNGKAGVVAVLQQQPLSLSRIANPRGVKEIYTVSVSPCGSALAVSDAARSVRVFETNSLKEMAAIRDIGERIAGPIGVAFCGTSKELAYSQACGFGQAPAVAEIVILQ